MRIINIVSNELYLKKQKLENELERILNSRETNTNDKVEQTLVLVNKLSSINSDTETWGNYINKNEVEKKD
jgi:hypothetical protein|tara:strand:+ start:2357 stop:2569 length:213 start_codon:yes stop_codon:yes gene_type:complete